MASPYQELQAFRRAHHANLHPPPDKPHPSKTMDASGSSSPPPSAPHDAPSVRAGPKPCEQCQQTASRYTCPGCGVRTCSLGCSSDHKTATKCSGKRNRVEFVQLNQYSWGRLMQDYSYLEEIHRHLAHPRLAQDPAAPPSVAASSIAPLLPSRNSNARREFLVRKAALEGVRLTLMPDGMSRRKLNMTHYNQKKKCMQWTVELVFRSGEPDKSGEAQAATRHGPASETHPHASHLVHQICSDTALIELLKRTLKLKKLKMTQERRRHLVALVEPEHDPAPAATAEESVVFVTRLGRAGGPEGPASEPAEVYVLESMMTVCGALGGTSVVEWPQFEVWTAPDWAAEMSAGRVRIRPRTGDAPPSLHAQALDTQASSALPLDQQTSPHLLASLLQYSSSDDDSD
ncbi:hypothetical protein PtA15_8A282 [Puccinia triticina]|uniref:HIT-type domain-containing protein n=1 Tax=Puccinia triticina TaxID=208348 RepID=A0ABY7CR15_9BASI|nr:uncharacterized protein PtA15_8A282 [Puccinia triticina]WAQ87378.1 hypothetical protein PtA15_8A282 [Puccinia triticina]